MQGTTTFSNHASRSGRSSIHFSRYKSRPRLEQEAGVLSSPIMLTWLGRCRPPTLPDGDQVAEGAGLGPGKSARGAALATASSY